MLTVQTVTPIAKFRSFFKVYIYDIHFKRITRTTVSSSVPEGAAGSSSSSTLIPTSRDNRPLLQHAQPVNFEFYIFKLFFRLLQLVLVVVAQ